MIAVLNTDSLIFLAALRRPTFLSRSATDPVFWTRFLRSGDSWSIKCTSKLLAHRLQNLKFFYVQLFNGQYGHLIYPWNCFLNNFKSSKYINLIYFKWLIFIKVFVRLKNYICLVKFNFWYSNYCSLFLSEWNYLNIKF